MKYILAIIMGFSAFAPMQGSESKNNFTLCFGAACVAGGLCGGIAGYFAGKSVKSKESVEDAKIAAARLQLDAEKTAKIQELEKAVGNLQKSVASLASNSGRRFVTTPRAGNLAGAELHFSDEEGAEAVAPSGLRRRSLPVQVPGTGEADGHVLAASTVDTPESFARARGQGALNPLAAAAASESAVRDRSKGSVGSSNLSALGATNTVH